MNKNNLKLILISSLTIGLTSSCSINVVTSLSEPSLSNSNVDESSESHEEVSSSKVEESNTSQEEISSHEEISSEVELSSHEEISSEVEEPPKEIINETNSVTSFVLPNTLQFLKDDPKPENASNVLTFNLAKGERENAQLILKTKVDTPLSYDISFSDFKNGSSTIKGSNIDTYVELYQNINEDWSAFDSSPKSWYPNGKSTQRKGYFPDALEPYDVTKYLQNNKITNENGDNQGFLFTFESSKYDKAGTYEGYVEIKFSNDELIRVKTIINIFDFELPSKNHCKMMIDINTDDFVSLYDNRWSTSKYYIDAYRFLSSRKISSTHVPSASWTMTELNEMITYLKESKSNPNVACYSLSMNYISLDSINISYKITSSSKPSSTVLENVCLPTLEDYTHNDGYTILGLKSTFEKLIEESSNEMNLFEDLSIYFPQADEPNNDKGYIQNILCQNIVYLARDYVLDHCNFVGKDKVKQSVEDIHYITTCELNSRIYNGYNNLEITGFSGTNSGACGLSNFTYKKVEGFVPLFTHFIESDSTYQRTMDAINNPDNEIWWYGCCQPVSPYPNFAVNSPMITSRLDKMLAYQLGIEGELYCKATMTSDYRNGVYTSLTEDEILSGMSTWEGNHGDGLLIYPVYNRLADYNKKTKSNIGYYSSLRLENLTEACDDYNYLYYANELIKQKNLSTTYLDRINEIITTLAPTIASITTNDYLFEAKRLELASIIEELEKK